MLTFVAEQEPESASTTTSAGHWITGSTVSGSGTPQPHWPGAVLAGSFGQPSLQSAVPSPSLSTSDTPQPQMPGAVLAGSFGQPSRQFAVPSPSESVSATPQPQI